MAGSPIDSGPLTARRRDRLRHALRPGWARTVLIRRAAAACLVVVAVVVAVSGYRAADGVEVVVAAHDLRPGQVLGAEDLGVQKSAPGALPAGVLRDSAAGLGRSVTGPVRAGEILTDSRLLSPQLPAELTGRRDARLVPVRLTDDAVTSLLREGDVVDVLTEDAEVLARRAVVAARTGADQNTASSVAPVLLAMDEQSAHRVAAAGLETALAVVLH